MSMAVSRSVLGLLVVPLSVVAGQTPGPVFVDGQAQIVPAFADSNTWIREELWVETEFDSDGDGQLDRMHVDVTRPAATRGGAVKLATIYETSPYFAGTSGARQYLWDVHQEIDGPPPPRTSQPHTEFQPVRPRISNSQVMTWVPRGFAVVHSESPGTGLSQGCPSVGGVNEELAPKAVIDWLNGRARGFTTATGTTPVVADWATGKVGMTGTSYNGTLPLAAATTGVEGLEAIIPVSPNTSYWHYYRSYGLVRHPGGWLGEDIDFLFDFIHSGAPATRDYCDRTIRDGEMAAGQDRTTGDWNSFWAERDYWGKLDGIRAATLMAHGFNDWNVMPIHSTHVFKTLEARGVPVRAYFHQGGHGGPPPLDMQNRWFSRWLYGVQNGVESEPRAMIVRETADRNAPTGYADWPHPDARAVQLHLTPGGSASGGLSVTAGASATETLVDDVSLGADQLAQAAESPHRLLYLTPTLQQPLHLSGTPQVTVRISADRPAVNLSVYLVALPWTEPERRQPNFSIITRGWADLQNRESVEHGTPLVPGEFVTMTFDLQPDDQIIPAGKQIGLMIFSSDRDFTLWPQPGARLSLDLAATSLTLPVVGGPTALAAAGLK